MKVIKGISIYLGTIIVLIVVFLFGIIMILEFGPSKTARNLFVNSAMESSAGKFMATLFLSKDLINEIQNQNKVEKNTDITDANLINIDESSKNKEIEIINITGSTYKGLLAVVNDPARVTVGVSGPFGSEHKGKTVKELAEKYNAVLAINGGGFEDANGMGNGGTPIGIVISEGKIVYGSENKTYELIGFDNNNKLIIGSMTGKTALEKGVRDALSFGPLLIVNGVPSKIKGSGSGLNPRTAIGQRKDGSILLLTIDGRQANSLGASFEDIINIMTKYGAVNAANLDGGSSTLMYYNGKYINNCASLYGPRKMPTGIIVK